MRRTLSWGTLLSLLVASPMALALGMAAPRVESTLDAPLQASLPLTDIGGLDPSLIKARLASADAFAEAGIPRTTLVESVNAAISRGPGGLTVMLSTSQAVHEPYLNLLLTLEWPGGRQRQEVTLLLDPPGYAQMPALQSESARSLDRPARAETAEPSPGPTIARRESAAAGRIRVASGDTLWVLADRVRPEGVGIERMMLALQQANPEAFPGGNINRLRAGATLDVPDRQAILASDDDAGRRVEQQNRLWQAQRDGEAGDSEAADGTVATRMGAEGGVENASGARTDQGQDPSRLTLLNDRPLDAPQAADGADAGAASLPTEARERLAGLEAQLADTRRALERAHEQRDQLAGQVGTLSEEVDALREQLEGLSAARQAAAGDSRPVGAQAEEGTPERARPPVETLGQAAWRWFGDNAVPLAAAALALLLALWLVVRRRARHAEEDAAPASRYTAMGGAMPGRNEPAMAGRETSAGPIPASPAVSPESPAAATASSQSPSDSAPEAETVSEAEIYLAYGRYDQARERLVQSLAADPGRHDLRVKLLTACVALGDHDAAEQEAAYLDAHGDEQQRAEARETLARLMPASPTVPGSERAVPTTGQVPAAESRDVAEPDASAPGPDESPSAEGHPEPLSGEADDEVAPSALADATLAEDPEAGRVIDYRPPSLDAEPEPRAAELAQPVVDFPDDPLGFDDAPSEIDDDHATLADERPAARGESPSTDDASGWIVEEVAFDPLDLDNERSTNHASPAGPASANAAAQLDHARQRLDRGEREAARELLDPLLEEEGTPVAAEARVLIERHRL
ncbi:type IV pilus assembly protein FimV [Modicisalibacter radicis]|uniref:type IV pilus assembly protein FimV n=1 Tax=Halomonas sp. EAR18 TaxID=2518972 RepID=UPI00109D6240|nr:FimV/HubP family polar landmark protein [Halomonas sp. EAR18]